MFERPKMLIFFIAFRYGFLSATWLVSIALLSLSLSLSLDGNKCVGVMEVCWSPSDVSSPLTLLFTLSFSSNCVVILMGKDSSDVVQV